MDARYVTAPRRRRRNPLPVAVAAVAALVLAACGGAAPTAAPTATPGGPVAPETPIATGTLQELRIVARNVAFEPTSLSATAGLPIRLTLDNQDSGIPHSVVVSSGGVTVTKTSIVSGPGTAAVDIDPPPAGVLALVCEVHPNMTASITVTAP